MKLIKVYIEDNRFHAIFTESSGFFSRRTVTASLADGLWFRRDGRHLDAAGINRLNTAAKFIQNAGLKGIEYSEDEQ